MYRTVYNHFKTVAQKLGIDAHVHDLRRTWATTAARQGATAFELKEALGWKSIAMPERYVANMNTVELGNTVSSLIRTQATTIQKKELKL